MLVKLGNSLGYVGKREIPISSGARIDCGWFKNNKLTHAFEVVIYGSIKEALYRLQTLEPNIRKRIVITEERIDETKKHKLSDTKVITTNTIELTVESTNILEFLKDITG